MTNILLTIYVIALFLAFFAENSKPKEKYAILAVFCFILALFAGLRDFTWPDTLAYYVAYQRSPDLFHVTLESRANLYSEKGFFYIGVIVKTLLDNYQIYFFTVAALSFIFLYKGLKQFTLFPLIGICAYIARFYFGRNLMQIRSGLSYAILLLGIKYIKEKKFWHYLLIVFIAYQFHRSAIVGIPVYFICNWVHLRKIHIVICVVISFIIGIFFQDVVHIFIEDNASDLSIGAAYTEAGGMRSYYEGLGMLNPMIYFQTFFLLAYTFLENKLSQKHKYYYIIRDCYLYSTMILICFCSYRVLSARTSTIFATLEYAIIPSVIFIFNKKSERWLAYAGITIVLSFFFYSHIN